MAKAAARSRPRRSARATEAPPPPLAAPAIGHNGGPELEARVQLPEKIAEVFAAPRGEVQYRAMYGGRGSAKSFSAALMASIWGAVEPLRILCTREYQSSIRESFHAELRGAISAHPWLAAQYDVGVDYIKNRRRGGTEFIFRGLRRNIQSIKSLARIDLTIVEEAEDVPEDSWQALEPTVFRNPRTEIWPIWNPRFQNSPVDRRFRKKPPSTGLAIAEVNWNDNRFFPDHLDKLRRRDLDLLDTNTYAHIWDGAYLVNSAAQVLAGKWKPKEFTPSASWQGPYLGGDFGYALDPTAGVKCWINGDYLFVEHEFGGRQIELDQTAARAKQSIPDFDQYISRWDSASPGSISMLQRYGLPRAIGAEKWPGSVEDGIRFLRSFKKILVHPRCKQTIEECRLYSYKVDPNTKDVLPHLVDAHNHYIDAIRYAMSPMVRQLQPARAVSGIYGNSV